jgi:hypothetical protein
MVLTILVAVLTAFTAFFQVITWHRDRDSATSVIMTKFDTDTISLLAWNSGRAPSTVVKCMLEFGPLTYEDMRLVPVDDSMRMIIPPTTASINGVALKLRLPTLTKRCTARRNTGEPAVRVDVEESNGPKMLRLPLSMADIGVIRDKKNLLQVDPCK